MTGHLMPDTPTPPSAAGALYWPPFGLLAMWEQGMPYRMDPETLDTLEESNLLGQLDAASLAAHYRIMTQPDGSKWVTAAGGWLGGAGQGAAHSAQRICAGPSFAPPLCSAAEPLVQSPSCAESRSWLPTSSL
jgi:hypothetical protein